MKPVISLQGIRVALGENFTLSVDDLSLQPGRIYALTGPNGAGKSTLLRVMALLIAPQSGSILFDSDSGNLTHQRRRVTLVEQSPYLFDGSVTDNLNYALKLRDIERKKRDERIKETLSNVGLEGFEQRKTSELSSGEIQRVALARALVLQPKLLLLDEPTANIDSNSLHAYEVLLGSLPEYGITVAFSTHDPAQAKRLGSRVLQIENGCIL